MCNGWAPMGEGELPPPVWSFLFLWGGKHCVQWAGGLGTWTGLPKSVSVRPATLSWGQTEFGGGDF